MIDVKISSFRDVRAPQKKVFGGETGVTGKKRKRELPKKGGIPKKKGEKSLYPIEKL